MMACLFKQCAGTENQRLWVARLLSFRSALAERRLLKTMVILREPEAEMDEIEPLCLAATSLPTVDGCKLPRTRTRRRVPDCDPSKARELWAGCFFVEGGAHHYLSLQDLKISQNFFWSDERLARNLRWASGIVISTSWRSRG